MDTRIELENYVRNALVEHIYKAERAYYLTCAIGDQAKSLNSRDNGNFGILFGAFQRSLQTDAIAAISRLYDKPHKKYKIRSIPSFLKFIEENCATLPEIKQIPNVKRTAINVGVPDETLDFIKLNQRAFAQGLVRFFRQQIRSIQPALKSLKDYRDKTVAHNENVTGMEAPLLSEIDDLISLSKNIVGIFGWAYLDYCYLHDSDYILTSDAKRPTVALKRLVKYLEQYQLGKCLIPER